MEYNYIKTIPTENLLVLLSDIKEEIEERKRSGHDGKFYNRQPSYPKKQFPPNQRGRHFSARLKFLDDLLNMDWSYLFDSERYSTENRFYVYAHVDPTAIEGTKKLKKINIFGTPFYIGKGTGERAYDFSRVGGHRIKLNYFASKGHGKDKIVNIVKDNLTEAEALELESKLIWFFCTKYEQQQGVLVNLDVGVRPKKVKFKKHKILLCV